MKISNNLILTTAVLFLFGITACQTKIESKTVATNPPAVPTANNSKSPENNANQPEVVKKDTENPVSSSPASPTEAYKIAFTARQKKDLPGLKTVLSKKMLAFFSAMAEAEKKTVDDELKELVAQPQAANAETRNEKITGEKASLEYLEGQGKWKTMDFVKEDGSWKLTFPAAPPMVIENTTKKHN